MGGLLVIGGYFPTAGTTTVNSIATWDGSEFGTLGAGVDGEIQALGTYNGDLIAGGRFEYAGGTPARNIARWDGDFTHAGGVQVSYVARWDGSTWSDVAGGVSMIDGGPTGLRGIEVHDGDLVIVGCMDFSGGVETINIARWGGVVWSPVGSGSDPHGGFLDLRVAALSAASYKGLLYEAEGSAVTRKVTLVP